MNANNATQQIQYTSIKSRDSYWHRFVKSDGRLESSPKLLYMGSKQAFGSAAGAADEDDTDDTATFLTRTFPNKNARVIYLARDMFRRMYRHSRFYRCADFTPEYHHGDHEEMELNTYTSNTEVFRSEATLDKTSEGT